MSLESDNLLEKWTSYGVRCIEYAETHGISLGMYVWSSGYNHETKTFSDLITLKKIIEHVHSEIDQALADSKMPIECEEYECYMCGQDGSNLGGPTVFDYKCCICEEEYHYEMFHTSLFNYNEDDVWINEDGTVDREDIMGEFRRGK